MASLQDAWGNFQGGVASALNQWTALRLAVVSRLVHLCSLKEFHFQISLDVKYRKRTVAKRKLGFNLISDMTADIRSP